MFATSFTILHVHLFHIGGLLLIHNNVEDSELIFITCRKFHCHLLVEFTLQAFSLVSSQCYKNSQFNLEARLARLFKDFSVW